MYHLSHFISKLEKKHGIHPPSICFTSTLTGKRLEDLTQKIFENDKLRMYEEFIKQIEAGLKENMKDSDRSILSFYSDVNEESETHLLDSKLKFIHKQFILHGQTYQQLTQIEEDLTLLLQANLINITVRNFTQVDDEFLSRLIHLKKYFGKDCFEDLVLTEKGDAPFTIVRSLTRLSKKTKTKTRTLYKSNELLRAIQHELTQSLRLVVPSRVINTKLRLYSDNSREHQFARCHVLLQTITEQYQEFNKEKTEYTKVFKEKIKGVKDSLRKEFKKSIKVTTDIFEKGFQPKVSEEDYTQIFTSLKMVNLNLMQLIKLNQDILYPSNQ